MNNADIATSIAKNTRILMISQIITWITSFALMMFLPRTLGSEDYGRLYLAISISSIFQLLIEFGGPYLITKEIARSRESTASLVSNALAICVMMWTISIVSMIVLAYLTGYSATIKWLIVILGVAKLWEGAGRVFTSCYQGFEMMQFPALGSMVERIAVASFGITALLMGAHSIIIALIMAASTFLQFGVLLKFVPRFIPRLPRFRMEEIKRLMKASLPYFLWAVFAVVYFRVDAVMLSLMAPEAVVGWYGAAYRFFDILMFLPSIFSTAVFPVLSRLWGKEDAETLANTTAKSLQFILLAGIPISIGVFSGSEWIISLLFGLKEYTPSVILLQIFAVGLLLVYIDFILISSVIASDKQRQWTVAALVAMLVNPVLNYFLIPYTQVHYGNGGIGSAIATLVTEFLVMCMALSLIPTKAFANAKPARTVKGLLAGALMAVSAYIMHYYGVPIILMEIISFGIYCIALIVFKTVQQSELLFMRNFFSLRNLRESLVTDKETKK